MHNKNTFGKPSHICQFSSIDLAFLSFYNRLAEFLKLVATQKIF